MPILEIGISGCTIRDRLSRAQTNAEGRASSRVHQGMMGLPSHSQALYPTTRFEKMAELSTQHPSDLARTSDPSSQIRGVVSGRNLSDS